MKHATYCTHHTHAGLCDAHVHVTACTANLPGLLALPESLVTARAARVLEGMLLRGFTTVRDAGGADWGLAQAVEEGAIVGPRLLFTGHALSQTGGHGDMRGKVRRRCAREGDAGRQRLPRMSVDLSLELPAAAGADIACVCASDLTQAVLCRARTFARVGRHCGALAASAMACQRWAFQLPCFSVCLPLLVPPLCVNVVSLSLKPCKAPARGSPCRADSLPAVPAALPAGAGAACGAG